MRGTMIWFNADKGHGFIRTEQDERLYVSNSGFESGYGPEVRCKGLEVHFDRQDEEGDARAVNVALISQVEPRRARVRNASASRLH
jgi:cold shock CspA family protein